MPNSAPCAALVNNAGITRDRLAMRMLKEEDFDAVLDVNLKGAFHFIRALYTGFLRQRSGRIVNISSVVGHDRQRRARPITPLPRRA